MLTFSRVDNTDDNPPVKEVLTFKGKMKCFLCYFIKKYLPKKTKRLIFISTFIGCAKEVNNPSKEMLSKINETLKVSSVDEAIGLPMIFGLKLWNEKLPEGIYLQSLKNPIVEIKELKNKTFSSAELRVTANTILSHCPRWLVYDSKRIMRNDVTMMLTLLPKLEEVK